MTNSAIPKLTPKQADLLARIREAADMIYISGPEVGIARRLLALGLCELTDDGDARDGERWSVTVPTISLDLSRPFSAIIHDIRQGFLDVVDLTWELAADGLSGSAHGDGQLIAKLKHERAS